MDIHHYDKLDGTIERYKVWIVTKGFNQKYGIDYIKTFASVTKINTVRVIFAITIIKDQQLYQLDIKNVFLNRELENVYMPQVEESFIWSKAIAQSVV